MCQTPGLCKGFREFVEVPTMAKGGWFGGGEKVADAILWFLAFGDEGNAAEHVAEGMIAALWAV